MMPNTLEDHTRAGGENPLAERDGVSQCPSCQVWIEPFAIVDVTPFDTIPGPWACTSCVISYTRVVESVAAGLVAAFGPPDYSDVRGLRIPLLLKTDYIENDRRRRKMDPELVKRIDAYRQELFDLTKRPVAEAMQWLRDNPEPPM